MVAIKEEYDPSPRKKVRVGVMILLTLLAAQFVLGVFTNLYISLPTSSRRGVFAMGSMMSATGGGLPLFMLHMMLGPLLVIVGIGTLVLATGSGKRLDLILIAAGLFGTLLAGYGGLSFLMGGGSNAASLLMAVGFLAAFSAYFAVLSLRH